MFLNFAPILFGMVVHQLYEGSKLAAEKEQGLTRVREVNAKKLRAAEKELARVQDELQEMRFAGDLRAAEILELQLQVAQLESEADELRSHVRRLEGDGRAKGHHAGG